MLRSDRIDSHVCQLVSFSQCLSANLCVCLLHVLVSMCKLCLSVCLAVSIIQCACRSLDVAKSLHVSMRHLMCLYICRCMCLCFTLCVCLLNLGVSIIHCVCLSLHVSIGHFVCLSVTDRVCLSATQNVCLPLNLFVYHSFVFLSLNVSVFLSVSYTP